MKDKLRELVKEWQTFNKDKWFLNGVRNECAHQLKAILDSEPKGDCPACGGVGKSNWDKKYSCYLWVCKKCNGTGSDPARCKNEKCEAGLIWAQPFKERGGYKMGN